MPEMLNVEVLNVSKRYGYQWALRSVTFSVENQGLIAILGPNGAGKSTLLKTLATHVTPTTGVIKVNGLNLHRNMEKFKKKIGFLAHESYLYDELTVKENLLFYASFFSVKESRVEEEIEFFKLGRYSDTQVKKLSHGLRKRAEIARSIIHEPEMLLLDEPFSGLDKESLSFMINYLEMQRGKTIFICSHSFENVEKICERAIYLKNGLLMEDKKL